ncbi:LacI family DNA-binding transcriptional regulator [Marinoscillum pacificum]|uniref:LacI family DNA-binding transcriptional regulator n=1 Tax=Marinoscillum pacificum TaxID=392723 RepID=UPI002157DD9C|nr:LacI family DNA-binding transcriptional regulator [Marinoscillum pacificum]
MNKKREVTIYDIARELNVSPSTVSRALKDHHSIGKKTKKAVLKLAEERGYQPNIIASSLRSNKTNTIGIITSWINRPFISSLISGVEMAANKSGFNVIISQSHDSYENEVANAKTLYGSRIEGLVVSLAMETTNYDHFQKFLKKNIPVVFVDRVPDDLNTTKVVINNYESGFKATEHLIEQGCKRIAHIGGVRHRNVYSERMNGYVAALKKHGLEVDSNLIVESDRLSSEEGYRIAEYLINLDARPDGVFSANDTAAVSFIKYAKSVGVNVPEDIAVIGFNNDPISTIIDPALSTVSHPAFEMGKLVAAQVLNQGRLPSELIQAQTIMLETELIIRESTLREKH